MASEEVERLYSERKAQGASQEELDRLFESLEEIERLNDEQTRRQGEAQTWKFFKVLAAVVGALVLIAKLFP